MATSDELRTAVEDFRALVPSMTAPEWYRHRNADVRDPKFARSCPWASAAGIYAFYRGSGELRYVGRALEGVGLAARVPDHLSDSRRGRADWDEVLDDPEAFVDVCALPPTATVWAPSLELFVCQRFSGLVNRRRC